jgi:hypothetical protein
MAARTRVRRGIPTLAREDRLVRGPAFVHRRAVRNCTPYIVDVPVTDENSCGCAAAAREPVTTTVVQSVIDSGDPWIAAVARWLERQPWRVLIRDVVVDRIPRQL